MIKITPNISLNEAEIKFAFIFSPGPGGQNVNKVATGVELRFNAAQSQSLPKDLRDRFIISMRKRITRAGEIILKGTRFRTQGRNKQDVLDRLITLLRRASIRPKKRKKTQPTHASIEKRLSNKKRHGIKKSLRGNVD